MGSDSKFFLGVVITAVVAVGAIIVFSGNKKDSVSGNTVLIDTSLGQKKGGDEAAKVKIVEFGDFQCPACAGAEPELQKILSQNPDIQFIYRHFPLPNHRNAESAAVAAEAAGLQGKFWPMHDLLFANQTTWANLPSPENVYSSFAEKLGLDVDKFREELKSDNIKKIVATDRNYGLELSINQTPTFFVNGKMVTGIQSASAWQKLISEAKQ